MEILSKYVTTELIIKNSRFINEAFPCHSQQEARELLKNQKVKYQDASHVCHAFVIGKAGEILGMSDAGEPSGTAGRPMLDVLKGRKCTDIMITVTRYFGGTLLGTGGLVKAYGDCVKSVLQQAADESAFELLTEKKSFIFETDYPSYELIKRLLAGYHVSELTEDFAASISISGSIYLSEYDELEAKLKDMSNGKIILM